MVMWKAAFRMKRDGEWLFLFTLIFVVSGCGQQAAQIPNAVGTAREDVSAGPGTSRPTPETSAAKSTSPPTAPTRITEAASLADRGRTSESETTGRELPTATAPRDGEVANGNSQVGIVETPGSRRSPITNGNPGLNSSPPAQVSGSAAPNATGLETQLAVLQIPPAWLDEVRTAYDTSLPWKGARLEIRRLLSLNTDAGRREAIKLTWIYLQKGDIGDGHEYPMYLYLGGEPVWAVRAHEEFLAQPHEHTPDHAYISLASLYARFAEFEKAKATLDEAMSRLPAPPWRIARQANLNEAFGDLYVAWGKADLARKHYAEAIRLYPTSNQPYGQHLLKRQADRTQSKLDLLSLRSLTDAVLRDGRYTSTALGYAGDLHVSLTVRDGRMADIQVKHEEKIDQGACLVIPQRIIAKQSLQVDGIAGATVTTSAIIDGTLQCLRKAGLQ